MNFYFSTQRPVGIGTYPGKPAWFNNFDKRIDVPCIDWKAWGVLEYTKPLTDKEVKDYDLAPADLVWIGCYRDLYNLDFWDRPDKYGDNNYMEVLMPVDWVKENIELTGYENYEEFSKEYTSDNTQELYWKAEADGVIYGREFR